LKADRSASKDEYEMLDIRMPFAMYIGDGTHPSNPQHG
jgi:hypothetical protein